MSIRNRISAIKSNAQLMLNILEIHAPMHTQTRVFKMLIKNLDSYQNPESLHLKLSDPGETV